MRFRGSTRRPEFHNGRTRFRCTRFQPCTCCHQRWDNTTRRARRSPRRCRPCTSDRRSTCHRNRAGRRCHIRCSVPPGTRRRWIHRRWPRPRTRRHNSSRRPSTGCCHSRGGRANRMPRTHRCCTRNSRPCTDRCRCCPCNKARPDRRTCRRYHRCSACWARYTRHPIRTSNRPGPGRHSCRTRRRCTGRHPDPRTIRLAPCRSRIHSSRHCCTRFRRNTGYPERRTCRSPLHRRRSRLSHRDRFRR